MRAMVRVADDTSFSETMLVEAKAVDGLYPLYGAIALSGDTPLADALAGATPQGKIIWRGGRTRPVWTGWPFNRRAAQLWVILRVELRAVLPMSPIAMPAAFRWHRA